MVIPFRALQSAGAEGKLFFCDRSQSADAIAGFYSGFGLGGLSVEAVLWEIHRLDCKRASFWVRQGDELIAMARGLPKDVSEGSCPDDCNWGKSSITYR
jgi:hypothetical protein